jgi:hypothetical protein
MVKTVVVTLTDEGYFSRARRTILDVRTRGKWYGDLVLITVGFNPSQNFLDFYNIIHKRVEHINTEKIVEEYKRCPLKTVGDNRHLLKLTQWDKFYVFDEWFTKWDKVIFFDAGLRVFDEIKYLDNLPYENKILAPDDAPQYDTGKRFNQMIEHGANLEVEKRLWENFSKDILNERYFLNCIWVYDTQLLKKCNKNDLIEAMNLYPICRCNEMTIMNLLFVMKHKCWQPFPDFTESGKRLFGWVEYDRDYGPHNTWRNFCYIKYPCTINLECD